MKTRERRVGGNSERSETPRSPRHEQVRLLAGEHIRIETDQPLIDGREVFEATGINGEVVAAIRLGSKDGLGLLLLDTRQGQQVAAPFLLITEDYQAGQSSNYRAILPDTVTTLGREQDAQFNYPSTVSRQQCSFVYNSSTEALYISDPGSTNGTFLTAYSDDIAPNDKFIDHSITGRAEEDAARRGRFLPPDSRAPHGYYRDEYGQSYPVIGRQSTSVKGGIYGTRSSEQVMVNEQHGSVEQVVGDFMSFLARDTANLNRDSRELMKKVMLRVANTLRYDEAATDKLSAPYDDHNGIIRLSDYIQAGVGVCRHQVLLTSLLIEEMIDAGYVTGESHVERNYDSHFENAHAWAMLRREGAEDLIVDTTNYFVGTRREAEQKVGWRYIVAPEDEAE